MTEASRAAFRRVIAAGEYWQEFPGIPGRHRCWADAHPIVTEEILTRHFDMAPLYNAPPNGGDREGDSFRFEAGGPVTITEAHLFEHENDIEPFAVRPYLAPITIYENHILPLQCNMGVCHKTSDRALNADETIRMLEGGATSPQAARAEPIRDTLLRVIEALKSTKYIEVKL